MPWKVSSVMEEKLRFILEYEAGEESMTELCQRYEISRETGYPRIRPHFVLETKW
jgi:putative transposase